MYVNGDLCRLIFYNFKQTYAFRTENLEGVKNGRTGPLMCKFAISFSKDFGFVS